MRTRKIPVRVYKRAYYGKLNESSHLLDLAKDGTIRLPTVTIKFVKMNVDDIDISNPPKLKENYGVYKCKPSPDWELLERSLNEKHYGFWQNLKYHISKKLRRNKNVRQNN